VKRFFLSECFFA